MVYQCCAHSFARNWQLPFLNQWKGENNRRKYFMINPHERKLLTQLGLNPQPPDHQSNPHPTEPPRSVYSLYSLYQKHYLEHWIIIQNMSAYLPFFKNTIIAFANSVDPDQLASEEAIIWIYTVLHSVCEFVSKIWIKESDWLTILEVGIAS